MTSARISRIVTGARIELWCRDLEIGDYLITYTVRSQHVLVDAFVERARDRLSALHANVVKSLIVPLPLTGEPHALNPETSSPTSQTTCCRGHSHRVGRGITAGAGPGSPDAEADDLTDCLRGAHRVPQL